MSNLEISHSGIGGQKVTEADLNTFATDIFSLPKYETSYVRTDTTEINIPVLDQNGPYRAFIGGNPEQYINLKDTKLIAKLKLVGPNDEELPYVDHEVNVVPNIINSLFESIGVEINGCSISGLAQEGYAYKAYLDNLLNNSPNNVDSQLITRIMIKDSPKLEPEWKYINFPATCPFPNPKDKPGQNATAEEKKAFEEKEQTYFKYHKYLLKQNEGFWTRQKILSYTDKHEFNLITPVYMDFFEINNLFPPNISITLIFKRTPRDFYMMNKDEAHKNCKIKIISLSLQVSMVTLSENVRFEHEKKFNLSEKANYNFSRCMVSTNEYGVGLNDLSWDNCLTGELPKQIFFFFVKTSSYYGTPTSSPFDFKNLDIAQVSVKLNNYNFPPSPLEIEKFTSRKAGPAYSMFLDNIGLGNTDNSCLVDLDSWVYGSTIFAFDLSPDKCNGFHLHEVKKGVLSLKIKVNTPLTDPHTLIVFSVYDKILSIDKFKNVYLYNV